MTTHTLHALLHAPGTILPARPPPRNFLAGMVRTQNVRDRVRQIPKDKQFPGQDQSKDGVWSITYLKNIVLKEMEEKGVLMKIPRGKWQRMQGIEKSQTDKAVPVEVQEVVVGETKKGKAGKNAAAKEADKHVWIIKEDYATLMAERTAHHDTENGKSSAR